MTRRIKCLHDWDLMPHIASNIYTEYKNTMKPKLISVNILEDKKLF